MEPIEGRLTLARRSIWQALDNWTREDNGEPFNFGFKFDFEREIPSQEDIVPAFSQLPALSIFPTQVSPDWYKHQMQQWPYSLDFALWVYGWGLPYVERTFEQIIRAIYQGTSPESNGMPIVKKVTGYYPMEVSTLQLTKGKLGDNETGGTKVIIATWNVILRLNFNPLAPLPQ